jgi:hypothetical protein
MPLDTIQHKSVRLPPAQTFEFKITVQPDIILNVNDIAYCVHSYSDISNMIFVMNLHIKLYGWLYLFGYLILMVLEIFYPQLSSLVEERTSSMTLILEFREESGMKPFDSREISFLRST